MASSTSSSSHKFPEGTGSPESARFTPSRRVSLARPAALLLTLLLTSCADAAPDGQTQRAEDPQPLSTPSPSADIDLDFEVGDGDRWVSGSARQEHRQSAGSVTVTDIRAAAHDDFDRFVVTLAGDDFPTHQAEIIPGPAIQCGSGEPVELPGNGALILRLEGARAHEDAGSSTLPARDLQPGLAALLEARMTCDFEGQVEWAFGITDATSFRLLELTDPTRVVIDIRH